MIYTFSPSKLSTLTFNVVNQNAISSLWYTVISDSLRAKLFPLLLQADPRREGVDRTEGRGNREPRGQREPRRAEPGADAPPRSLHHCLGYCILPYLLLPSQRTLHPQTHPAQPHPRHGAHGGHDTGIRAHPYLCPYLHIKIYSTFSLIFFYINRSDHIWRKMVIGIQI